MDALDRAPDAAVAGSRPARVADRPPEPVIVVRGLRKSYGGVERVHGVSFEVRRGQIFGFLGVNGAGKTTTIEILEGYRHRDGGDVAVLGTDPARAGRAWRNRIGASPSTRCSAPRRWHPSASP